MRQADYLVSYRILELGVLYGERSKKDLTVQREARARLHVRVQAAEDGRVVHATALTVSRTDEVDRRLASTLANFHYMPYGYGLPLSESTADFPTSKRVEVRQQRASSESAGSQTTARVVAAVLLIGMAGIAVAAGQ